MKNRAETDDEAVSIQVGFVLNTGLLTTFIAIVLVIISGGFGEDVSTEEELQLVADKIEANMIEADRLTVTSEDFTAFFEPPDSDVQYQAGVDLSGELTLTAAGEPVTVTRDLDDSTLNATKVDGNDIQFGQNAGNIILDYDGSSNTIEMDVQRDVVG
jgi:hypothetical protein